MGAQNHRIFEFNRESAVPDAASSTVAVDALTERKCGIILARSHNLHGLLTVIGLLKVPSPDDLSPGEALIDSRLDGIIGKPSVSLKISFRGNSTMLHWFTRVINSAASNQCLYFRAIRVPHHSF
jgi:hypothetical protein